jgi:hypothetical protein
MKRTSSHHKYSVSRSNMETLRSNNTCEKSSIKKRVTGFHNHAYNGTSFHNEPPTTNYRISLHHSATTHVHWMNTICQRTGAVLDMRLQVSHPRIPNVEFRFVDASKHLPRPRPRPLVYPFPFPSIEKSQPSSISSSTTVMAAAYRAVERVHAPLSHPLIDMNPEIAHKKLYWSSSFQKMQEDMVANKDYSNIKTHYPRRRDVDDLIVLNVYT